MLRNTVSRSGGIGGLSKAASAFWARAAAALLLALSGGVCAAIGGACSAYQLAMAARRALSVAGIFWPVSSET